MKPKHTSALHRIVLTALIVSVTAGAQAAVAQYEEFKGNVAFVGTKDFYHPKEVSPSGQGYHWNTNAETYCLIGEAMAKAMFALEHGASR